MNLLKEIDSNDIEMLINDLELENEGYVINFIIDPYDIFRFTFPYGIKNQSIGQRHLDDVGDEAVGYSHIFENYKPIILDEYKLELYLNRDNIKRNIDETIRGINHNNLFEILEDKLVSGNQTKTDKLYKELEDSYTFLLSTVLFTTSFIKHFDDIFTSKLQIDKFNLSRKTTKLEEQLLVNDDSIILKTFSENKRSSWSASYYKEWVKSKNNDAYFKLLHPREISMQLANTYRDFVVIDRVCRINKNLQESDKLNGKYLFLYFSSANKSKDLFSTPSVIKHFPVINGKPFNVLRSVKHAYLLFLFSNPSIKETIRLLKKLKNIAELSENSNLLAGLDKADHSDFADVIEKLPISIEKGKDFERINVEKTYVGIQVKVSYLRHLELKIEELKTKKGDWKELRTLYEEVLKKAKSSADSIKPLNSMQFTYLLQSNFNVLIQKMIQNKELNLHTGKDIVVGNYQHLPILLFLNNNINKQLSGLLKNTVDFTVKSPRLREEALRLFIKAVASLYAESENLYATRRVSERKDFYYSSVLIRSLIFLILPYDGDSADQENEVYESLLDIYRREVSLGKDSNIDISNRYQKVYKKWRDDFYYFLIWSSRRRNEIDESLQLADHIIKSNPNDPRFYHGKSLALYNKFAEKDSLNVRDLMCLKSLLESTSKAISLYKVKLKSINDEKIRFYLKSSIVALQNTLIYSVSLYILQFLEKTSNKSEPILPILKDEDNSEFNLQYLRNILDNEIKPFINDSNQKIKDFPELAQTESVLELCEAIGYLKKGNNYDFTSKIIEAKKRIDDSLRIEKNNKLYKITKEKILEWEKKVKRFPQTEKNKITKLVISK